MRSCVQTGHPIICSFIVQHSHLDAQGLVSTPGNWSVPVPCAGWPTSRGCQATAPRVSLPPGLHRTAQPGNQMPTGSARSGLTPVCVCVYVGEDRLDVIMRSVVFILNIKPTLLGQSFEPNSFFKQKMNDSWRLSSIPSKWLQARIMISLGWDSNQVATDSRVSCGGWRGRIHHKQKILHTAELFYSA